MKTLTDSLALLVIAALAAAIPARGESYTVVLVNGTRIESRYEPRPAPDDPDKLLLLTEMGNRISLNRRDVSEIRSAAPGTEYERAIDTRPRFVGRAPNDRPAAGDPASSRADRPVAQAVINHLVQQSLDAMEERLRRARANTVSQFAEPPLAGSDRLTGLPAGLGLATRRDPQLLLIQGIPPPLDLQVQGLLVSPVPALAAAPPSAFAAGEAGAAGVSAAAAPAGGG